MKTLPVESARRLLRAAVLVRYGEGELIHNRGDGKPGLSIVHRGHVRVGTYGYEGTFILSALLGPGQTFGEFTLLAGLPRTHAAVAASSDTEVHQLSRERFLTFFRDDPAVAQALLSTTLVRMHLLLESLDHHRRLPLDARVASALVGLTATLAEPEIAPIRQADLACMLGMSRMSVSKALKALAGRGLVELGYGVIRIPDPSRLADWLDDQAWGDAA